METNYIYLLQEREFLHLLTFQMPNIYNKISDKNILIFGRNVV